MMINGVLLDYGGTIDTNGLHWASVLWDHYRKYDVPVSQSDFRLAYSFGERALAIRPLVKPEHSFLDVLILKTIEQFNFLKENGYHLSSDLIQAIAMDCNDLAQKTVKKAEPVLAELATALPLVMVSNFYGNLNTVLETFGIRQYFRTVVESAVVGVRKPEPAIYQLGVDELKLDAASCIVVGDSFSKDIVPAKTIGCKAVWLNVAGWDEGKAAPSDIQADAEITDFAKLPQIIRQLAVNS